MKKIIVLIFLQIFFAQIASAKVNVFQYPVSIKDSDKIKENIPQTSILRGNFEQIKTLDGIDKKLTSSGSFLFSKESGVFWQTKKPFLLTLIFTKNGLMQIVDGKKDIISSGNQVFFREFSQIFQAILSSDYQKLNDYFDVFFVVEKNKKWILGLRPHSDIIKDVMTEIVIHGDKDIKEVEIKEKFNDKTLIKFRDLKAFPTDLSKKEKLYFDSK